MDTQLIIKEFKNLLKNLYRENLNKVIVFGSQARKDSTIGKEIDRMIDIITDVNLKYNALVSVIPISVDDYNNLNSPLLLNIRKEGVIT